MPVTLESNRILIDTVEVETVKTHVPEVDINIDIVPVITNIEGDPAFELLTYTHSGGSEDQTEFNFTINENTKCDILIVGGGGSGGGSLGAGGGGGGVLFVSQKQLQGTYTIKVGKGGDSVASDQGTGVRQGNNGKNSEFAGTIVYGGGGGGDYNNTNGLAGGSGGGGGWSTGVGGGRLVPTYGSVLTSGEYYGEAGKNGNSVQTDRSGVGGSANYSSSITGVSYTYSTGGAGRLNGDDNNISYDNGINYGDGGGGAGWLSTTFSGKGASGIVIIKKYLEPVALYEEQTTVTQNPVLPADSTNLVAHYKFDGDFTDSSGNGHTLITNTGTPTTSTTQFKFGESAYLISSSLKTNSFTFHNKAFSISVWIYTTGSSNRLYNLISQNKAESTNQNLHIRVNKLSNTSIKYTMAFWGNDLNSSSGYNDYNKWAHIVFQINSYGYKEIWRNGVMIANDTNGSFLNTDNADIVIGNWTQDNKYFEGYLDNLRIYDKALSAYEIDILANNKIETPDYKILTFEYQEPSYPIIDDLYNQYNQTSYSVNFPEESECDILIVGGGGGGGWSIGGGGGGGGVIYCQNMEVGAGTYQVVVGNGGIETGTSTERKGNDSSVFGLTARGGGGGARSAAWNNFNDRYGSSGGSSGGAGAANADSPGITALTAGTNISTTSIITGGTITNYNGFKGGNSIPRTGNYGVGSAGGGGANEAGNDGDTTFTNEPFVTPNYIDEITGMSGWTKIKHRPANDGTWFAGDTFSSTTINSSYTYGSSTNDNSQWAVAFDHTKVKYYLFIERTGLIHPDYYDRWHVFAADNIDNYSSYPTWIPSYKSIGYPNGYANGIQYNRGGTHTYDPNIGLGFPHTKISDNTTTTTLYTTERAIYIEASTTEWNGPPPTITEVYVKYTDDIPLTTPQPQIPADNYQYIELTYENEHPDYTSTTNGNQRTHTINFPENVVADILVVGGGGGGGSDCGGGGGGGGVLYAKNVPIPANTYTIKVGKGGTSMSSGNTSEAFGAIAKGGGSGGGGIRFGNTNATSGGSGGGGGLTEYVVPRFRQGGGIGTNTIGTILNNGNVYNYNGNIGGNCPGRNTFPYALAGGGGGANQEGVDGIDGSYTGVSNTNNNGKAKGGDGIDIDITGNVLYWGAGGGGGSLEAILPGYGGRGGGGGGGQGFDSVDTPLATYGGLGGVDGYSSPIAPTNTAIAETGNGGHAGAGTGSGGGGGGYYYNKAGGNGGSGIVIIRYYVVSNITHKYLSFTHDTPLVEQKTGVGGWSHVGHLKPETTRTMNWFSDGFLNGTTTRGTAYNYDNDWELPFSGKDQILFVKGNFERWAYGSLSTIKTSGNSWIQVDAVTSQTKTDGTPVDKIAVLTGVFAKHPPYIVLGTSYNAVDTTGSQFNSGEEWLYLEKGDYTNQPDWHKWINTSYDVYVRSSTTTSTPTTYTLNVPEDTTCDVLVINNTQAYKATGALFNGTYNVIVGSDSRIEKDGVILHNPNSGLSITDDITGASIQYTFNNPIVIIRYSIDDSGGAGGDGVPINITGTSYYWGAGGGGGAYSLNSYGRGGKGGGGSGGSSTGFTFTGDTYGINDAYPAGADGRGGDGGRSTGGGGGGSGYEYDGGSKGGSGVVIIRYSTKYIRQHPAYDAQWTYHSTNPNVHHYGNVGIGTLASETNKLTVKGDMNMIGNYKQNDVNLGNWYSSDNIHNIHRLTGNVGIGTTDPQYSIDTSGVLYASHGGFTGGTSTNWATSSDERIKDNITLASNETCYENVKNINLYKFNYKEQFANNKNETQYGFIAQEVQKYYPKAVKYEKIKVKDDTYENFLTINQTQLNYTLFGAVKHLQQELENIKVKLGMTVPVAEETNTTEEPVIEETNTTEEPVIEETNTTEVPVTEETNTTEEPVIEETNTTEEPVIEETNTTEEPVN